MKKTAFIIALVFTLLLATPALSGCSDGGGLTYPDYPQASADTDSWEQWRSYDDSVIEIDWFVDDTVWTFTMESSSLVADRILEKTGVRINFIRQNSQGTQLNSLLSVGTAARHGHAGRGRPGDAGGAGTQRTRLSARRTDPAVGAHARRAHRRADPQLLRRL